MRPDCRNGRKVAQRNHVLLVDHKQHPLAHALVGPIGAVPPGDVALRLEIRKQGEAQAPVLGKGLIAPHAVDRYPEELGPMSGGIRT